MPDPAARYQQALQLRAEGRLGEAIALLESIAAQVPTAANARGMLGLTRCNAGDFERGLADLREAIRIDPRNADVHCNLGVALFACDQLDEAEAELRRSLALVPAHADAFNNLSLVLKSRGDFEGAVRAAQRALQLRPDFFQAHINLAHSLLALGRFGDAWKRYSARPHPRVNLRDPHLAATVDHADRLPVRPSPIVLHGEQGLGDTLFFLRFAPKLRALGHRLAFWGDARLHPILARAGIFEHFLPPESAPAPGLAVVWVGDLPLFLGANDPAGFPDALPIAVDRNLRDAAERRLSSFGPAPYIGLTWRAGMPRQGRIALSKNVEPELLQRALANVKGTLVSLQRNPAAGELDVHDASDVNADLDEALAMLDVLDDYVTVSNTNVHLRASLGRGARVLVPWPPEWRWLENAQPSPWFREMRVYRQSRDGDWTSALQQLARDLDG